MKYRFFYLTLFSLLVFLYFSFASVHAQDITISFTDFGLTSQDIDIYYPNGTFIQTVRSNESVSLDRDTDYQFVIRPQKLSLLDNPQALFTMILGNGFIRVMISIFILVAFYKLFTR